MLPDACVTCVGKQVVRAHDSCNTLQIVPMKTLTLSELSEHDGNNPDKPMYLAIRGTIFDVTLGKRAQSSKLVAQASCEVATMQQSLHVYSCSKVCLELQQFAVLLTIKARMTE